MAEKTIIDAITDPLIFGPWYTPLANWRPWLVAIKAIYGLKMDAPERRLFRQMFGERSAPTQQAAEALILAGRGAGKTQISATIVSYMAALCDWSHLKRKVR